MRLTTASYLVLGLVEKYGPVTPYGLKSIAAETVVNFWSLPHTQIYTQCDRLTEAGHLDEQRESEGRRRRQFSITKSGSEELDEWRESDEQSPVEFRDLAMLKLFFGADPKQLADQQIAAHSKQLALYESYAADLESGTLDASSQASIRRTLDAGIGHQREFVRFWKSMLD